MSKMLRTTTLAIVASVSMVATYVGLTETIPSPTVWWLCFCAAIASAVGAMIFTFWNALFEAAIKPVQLKLRATAWAAVIVGGIAIVSISSFWNAVGIGGHAAATASLQGTATKAETSLADAMQTQTGYRSHLPALQSLSSEIEAMAACEGRDGCLTGSPGREGVYQTLIQLQSKAEGLIAAIVDADESLIARSTEGRACLAELRIGLASESANDVSEAADCVNAVLAEIGGNRLSDRIADAMEAFTAGVVLPASLSSERQRVAVARILSGLQDRADAIATSARASARAEAPEPVTIERMGPIKAVIVHWDEIITSWVTAIGIDLFPALLLFVDGIMTQSRRLRPDGDWHKYTAGDMLAVSDLLVDLKEATEKPSDPEPKPVKALLPNPSPNGVVYRTEDLSRSDYWYEPYDVREEGDESQTGGRG